MSSSQPSFLQGAQSLGISGGNLVNAGGDFVSQGASYNGNITIHNHYPRTQSNVEDDPQLATVPVANQPAGNVNSETPEDDPSPSPPPPLPIQKSCDIYSRLLAVKGRGFPLWIPGPSANLPIEYRKAGIAIGDVGIFTKSGSFDFLFNVCLPKNHPINQAGVPDGFYPLDDIPLSDILRHDEFDAGSHIASTFVKKSGYNDALLANGLSFESSAREGAILTMPYGAVAQDLASVVPFEDYMAQHSENWYKFIIGVRGRKIGNGSVRLVVGADMTSAWGMATFAQTSAQSSPLQLRFKPTADSPVGQTYSWEYSGVADAKSGPSSTEMARLRSDGNADMGSTYINQSLFVRTLTATFEKTIWDELMSNIQSARISARNSRKLADIYSPLGTSGGTSSVTSNENATTWTRANPNNLAVDSLMTSPAAQLEPSLYIVGDTTTTIVHPSNKINDLLLKTVQDVFSDEAPRMIITKDQAWISILDKNDMVLPSGEELYRRIMEAETIQITLTNNGVILWKSGQDENIFGPITTLPTEIQHPHSNNDLPQWKDSYPTDLDEKLTASDRGRAVAPSTPPHTFSNLSQPTVSSSLSQTECSPKLAILTPTKEPSPTALRKLVSPRVVVSHPTPDAGYEGFSLRPQLAPKASASSKLYNPETDPIPVRQLFDHRRDDPVRFSVLARPTGNYRRPSPTRKLSGDYVSASSTSSYVSSTSSSAWSSTTDASSVSSASFNEQPSQGDRAEVFSAQAKTLYRAITNLETKIMQENAPSEPDNGMNTRVMLKGNEIENEDLEKEKWMKQIEDHKLLAQTIHSFLELCLSPSVPASLGNIPTKYNIINRLWTCAFRKLFESLRRASFTSPLAIEHLQGFLYYAYTFYTGLLEEYFLNSFKFAWLEALGDLARYQMAVAVMVSDSVGGQGGLTTEAVMEAAGADASASKAGEDNASMPMPGSQKSVSDASAVCIDGTSLPSIGVTAARLLNVEPEKERWRNIARDWYGAGLANSPATGKFHHRLGILSMEVEAEELRSLYHFVKSMTVLHPFPTSKEAVLPLWSHAKQARRSVVDAHASELFVFLHGMLFTNTQLDVFQPTLARFIKRLDIEGAEEHEWIMMATINISSILEYGRPSSLLRKIGCVGPREVTGPQVAAAIREKAAARVLGSAYLREIEEKDVDDDQKSDNAIPANSIEEQTDALKFALELTFVMLSHLLRNPTHKASQYTQTNLNPYLTVILTFLSTILKHRPTLDILECSIPWVDLASFFGSIPLTIMYSQRLMNPPEKPNSQHNFKRWIMLTSDCPPPLGEDWCMRGMQWVGSRVYERGFWKSGEDRKTELEVLEMIESVELADETVEDNDSDDTSYRSSLSNSSNPIRRWVRIARCGVDLAGTVEGFNWRDGSRKWTVEGKLAEKLASCQMVAQTKREKEHQRMGKRIDDVDDNNASGVF